jgi:hypothetical protein
MKYDREKVYTLLSRCGFRPAATRDVFVGPREVLRWSMPTKLVPSWAPSEETRALPVTKAVMDKALKRVMDRLGMATAKDIVRVHTNSKPAVSLTPGDLRSVYIACMSALDNRRNA